MNEILQLGLNSNIQIGVQYRLVCPACNRKILSLINTGTHIKAICFSTRCIHNRGYNIPLKLGSIKPSQYKPKNSKKETRWYLPKDNTSYIPKKFIDYLKRYGVLNLSGKYHFSYSNYYDRLVIPTEDGGWVGRSITEQPKWLKFTDINYFMSVYNKDLPNNKICIVEDVISAIKLGEVVRTLALLTTSINNNLFHKLAKLPKTSIYIWLDGDLAGMNGSYKVIRRLSQLPNLKLKYINIPKKDPKECSYFQIKKELEIC